MLILLFLYFVQSSWRPNVLVPKHAASKQLGTQTASAQKTSHSNNGAQTVIPKHPHTRQAVVIALCVSCCCEILVLQFKLSMQTRASYTKGFFFLCTITILSLLDFQRPKIRRLLLRRGIPRSGMVQLLSLLLQILSQEIFLYPEDYVCSLIRRLLHHICNQRSASSLRISYQLLTITTIVIHADTTICQIFVPQNKSALLPKFVKLRFPR